jgi:hypothetical protein
MLYKYPQARISLCALVARIAAAASLEPEYELIDTGVFDDDRYFDVDDRICQGRARRHPDTVQPRPHAAALHLLPQLWFRNTWSWSENAPRPSLHLEAPDTIVAHHPKLGMYRLHWEDVGAVPLFCDNESNPAKLWNDATRQGYWKDAFHERIVNSHEDAVNPCATGTKAAVWSRCTVPGQGRIQLRLRLRRQNAASANAGAAALKDFDATFAERIREADQFYDHRAVQRQAFAGMIWSKQFFYFDVPQWLRATRPSRRRRRSAARAQPRMDASQQRRHHLDAGQVGVSLVRLLGSGVSLHSARR